MIDRADEHARLAHLVTLANAAAHDEAAAARLSQIENAWLVEADAHEVEAEDAAEAALEAAIECWRAGCSVLETALVDVLSGDGQYLGYVEPVGVGWIAHIYRTDPSGWNEHTPLPRLHLSVDAAARAVVTAAAGSQRDNERSA